MNYNSLTRATVKGSMEDLKKASHIHMYTSQLRDLEMFCQVPRSWQRNLKLKQFPYSFRNTTGTKEGDILIMRLGVII